MNLWPSWISVGVPVMSADQKASTPSQLPPIGTHRSPLQTRTSAKADTGHWLPDVCLFFDDWPGEGPTLLSTRTVSQTELLAAGS